MAEHYDDCGENLSSLKGINLSAFIGEMAVLHQHWLNTLISLDDSSDSEEEEKMKGIQLFMLGQKDFNPYKNLQKVHVDSIENLTYLVGTKPYTHLIAEVCGGEARTSQLATRQRHHTGPNFDLICDCDLTKSSHRTQAYEFFEKNKVLVAVMAPICGCFGPMSHLNWKINPDAMEELYLVGKALAIFCAKVAGLQIKKGLHFLQEQPYRSALYDENLWPTIFDHHSVVMVVYDRCMAGLKVVSGPKRGMHIKKPSSVVTNSEELALPFYDLRCYHRHEHLSMMGQSKHLKRAEVWTWDEASRVFQGIKLLLKSLRTGRTSYNVFVSFYPAQVLRPIEREVAQATPGEPQRGYHSRAPNRDASSCDGCRLRRAVDDWTHSRIVGQCGYPHHSPYIYECEACVRHYSSEDSRHLLIPGKCRYVTQPGRAYRPRAGRHPRSPATPASSDPTAGMPGTRDGRELGQEAEHENNQRLDEREAEIEKAQRLEQDEIREARSYEPPEEGEPTAARVRVDRAVKSERGAPPERPQKVWTKPASGDPGGPPNWSSFDIGKVLRSLKVATASQAKYTFRQLHLR